MSPSASKGNTQRRDSLRKGSLKDGQGEVEGLESPPCYDDACQTPAIPE
jgi:hypothetical protein